MKFAAEIIGYVFITWVFVLVALTVFEVVEW